MTSALSPKEARALVETFHAGAHGADDLAMDVALGLSRPAPGALPGADDPEGLAESLADLPTPYGVLRGLFQALAPPAGSTVFDLGCGHGRVLLYGAIVSPASFVGVELVPSRAEAARRACARLGLSRVLVRTESATEADLGSGDVFYLFRPFGAEVEARVLDRLAHEGRRRPITVVTHRMIPGRLDASVFSVVSRGTLEISRSAG